MPTKILLVVYSSRESSYVLLHHGVVHKLRIWVIDLHVFYFSLVSLGMDRIHHHQHRMLRHHRFPTF
jgi:hypothetical protein